MLRTSLPRGGLVRSFFCKPAPPPLKVCHTPSEQMRHQTNTRTQRNKHNTTTTPNTCAGSAAPKGAK